MTRRTTAAATPPRPTGDLPELPEHPRPGHPPRCGAAAPPPPSRARRPDSPLGSAEHRRAVEPRRDPVEGVCGPVPDLSSHRSRRTTFAAWSPDQLDADIGRAIGAAFVQVVDAESGAIVVVGYDMRESSPDCRARSPRARSRGADVMEVGLGSTDLLYFASGSLDLPGAMFTASHNPAQYNGIKLCRAGAAPIGQDSGLAEIRRLAERGVPDGRARSGRARSRARPAGRLRRLPALARRPVDIRPLRVVVDAGNGMAGHTVPAVLAGLPLDDRPAVLRAGRHVPQPRGQPAGAGQPGGPAGGRPRARPDLGLAFDGDADRCFVVDERGDPVSPSAVTAWSPSASWPRAPGDVIIHNLITSRAVPEIVREHGGVPVRTRVGHSFIKEEMAGPGRSSAASTRRTTTSATSGAPTPACSPRCTSWRRWASRTGRCPSSPPSTSGTPSRARSTARWTTSRRQGDR